MTQYHLDITRDRCPMTFVKTKLELEKLRPGDTLEVLLTDGEPLNNVPKTAKEQGFTVLPSIQYTLAPGDFKAQCLTLKESGANYAFLANTSGANISAGKPDSEPSVTVITPKITNASGAPTRLRERTTSP